MPPITVTRLRRTAMPAPSPLSCPQRCVHAEQAPALAELRESIHRATAGRVSRLERQERQRFSEGVLVNETSISCWAALVWPAGSAA
jgi:hypothetical protein